MEQIKKQTSNHTVYLAIDIGASSGRHIAAYLDQGKLVLKEVYRFPNGAVNKNGRLFWDAENLFAQILNGLKAAGEAELAPT